MDQCRCCLRKYNLQNQLGEWYCYYCESKCEKKSRIANCSGIFLHNP